MTNAMAEIALPDGTIGSERTIWMHFVQDWGDPPLGSCMIRVSRLITLLASHVQAICTCSSSSIIPSNQTQIASSMYSVATLEDALRIQRGGRW